VGRVGFVAARVLARAPRGDPPPSRLGGPVRPAPRIDLRRCDAGAVSADEHGWRPRRRVHTDRRARRPLAAVLRPRGAGQGERGHDRTTNPRRRDQHRKGPGQRRAHRPGRRRVRDRRRLRRDVRGRDRAARGGADPGGADVAPVRRHGAPAGRVTAGRFDADRPAAAVAARPRPARLLPPGGRRSRHGWLRAAVGPVDRHRALLRRGAGGLQRQAVAAGLGPVLRDHRERAGPRPRADGYRDHDHDQRAGGVHAGQRVLPRRDRGRGLLRRRRVLRASPAPAGSGA
jgi:hypothetical protein